MILQSNLVCNTITYQHKVDSIFQEEKLGNG